MIDNIMTKERSGNNQEPIDFLECSFDELREKFHSLGLDNYSGDLSEKINSLQDESVKEMLTQLNDRKTSGMLLSLAFNSNDGVSDYSSHELHKAEYAEAARAAKASMGTKLAYMVQNNFLKDEILLQRDNESFYSFYQRVIRV